MNHDPIQELRSLANQLELAIHSLAKCHDIEHLGGPQGRAVAYLYHNQKKEVSIKDIEKTLQISKSVASNLIKRMEKNGFVDIVPSEKDKRYKHIRLSPYGLEKAEKLHAFIQEMDKTVFKGISRKDFDHIHKVASQIKANLAAAETKKP